MASVIVQQLDTYGPDRCESLDYEQASGYAHRLVREQYENFTVVSRLLPARYRDDFAHVYAFCRWADDLGDEIEDRDRALELLAWWRRELAACYAGEPRHPVCVALQRTVERHAIPARPFEDLIEAFEIDQRVDRYETWDQVVGYCQKSADPVGRLVLYVSGYRDAQRQALSDATCTALQLVNHWQDVRRDILERDRIYLPAEALAAHGLTHDRLIEHVRDQKRFDADEARGYAQAVHELVDRTWPLFRRGRGLWPLLRRDVRLSIRLFTLGGEAIMRRIERSGCDTADRRPRLSRAAKLGLMVRALAGRYLGVGG